MAGFVDIACNFTHESFKDDLETVIANAEIAGVEKFVLLCASLKDLDPIKVIQNKAPEKYFISAGIHPHHASEINDEYLKKLHDAVNINNPHAIGETGLDFFRNLSTYEEQIYAFEEQIKIAINTNKPLFLHQRDSHNDFIKILRKYSSDINRKIVHCFTGTQEQLDDYLELDCFIGITGWICDAKRNIELRNAIKGIPLSKLMIETDCPYLLPKNIAKQGKSLALEYFNEDGDGVYPMTVQIVGKGSLYDPNNEKVRS